MSQQRKTTEKSRETLTNRMTKIELGFKEMVSQLKQTNSHLEAQAERVKECEQRVSKQIMDVENQVREKMAPGPNPSGLITLEEGCAVNLEELENKMEQKFSLLAAREMELQELEKKISEEIENLRAEIKEKDLLLAAREMEVKNLKQSMVARIEELENLAKNRTAGMRKATRLVSFLVDIGKKH